MLKAKPPRPKKCAHCKTHFQPARNFVSWCSPDCAVEIAKAKQAKQKAQEATKERAETRERKERLKTYGDHVAGAEKAVRDFRRTEELLLGSGCISCGKSQAEIIAAQGWKVGGAFDAGHWMGKGARPELRLEPNNIWLQCKSCNGGSAKYARKGESVKEAFEAGVIARLGEEAAMALKHDHRARHYTVEQLKEITADYRARLRDLKKSAQNQ